MLNVNVDINGLRQVELITELQIKRDKKITVYVPKLYFAISSKPVAEVTGEYRTWQPFTYLRDFECFVTTNTLRRFVSLAGEDGNVARRTGSAV